MTLLSRDCAFSEEHFSPGSVTELLTDLTFIHISKLHFNYMYYKQFYLFGITYLMISDSLQAKQITNETMSLESRAQLFKASLA